MIHKFSYIYIINKRKLDFLFAASSFCYHGFYQHSCQERLFFLRSCVMQLNMLDFYQSLKWHISICVISFTRLEWRQRFVQPEALSMTINPFENSIKILNQRVRLTEQHIFLTWKSQSYPFMGSFHWQQQHTTSSQWNIAHKCTKF